jgi:hypothetical protein
MNLVDIRKEILYPQIQGVTLLHLIALHKMSLKLRAIIKSVEVERIAQE